MFEQDLTIFFADSKDVATFNGATSKVLLDCATLDDMLKIGESSVNGTTIKITYPTSVFKNIRASKDIITVNGTKYMINKILKLDDGSISEAYLLDMVQ